MTIREYFLAASYVASIPKDNSAEDYIISSFAESLATVKPENLHEYLKNMFHVIEGDEVTIDRLEEDND